MTQIFEHLYEILNCDFLQKTAQTILDSVCQQFVYVSHAGGALVFLDPLHSYVISVLISFICSVGSVIIFSTGAAILALFSVTCAIALYMAHKFKLNTRVRTNNTSLLDIDAI